jgi:hypothetical protein
MPLINTLERKFGRWGIPGLIRIVCGFMVLNYLLFLLNPEMVELLYLDVGKVMKGEVWRLFTFALVPPSKNALSFFFFVYFMWWAGESLEQAWGAFRFTLYYLGSVLGAVLFLFVFHFFCKPELAGIPIDAGHWALVVKYNTVCTFFLSLVPICTFAGVFPEQEIRLMGLIPVKMKWVGFAAGGLALMAVFDDVLGSYYSGLALLFVFAGFFMVFVPHYINHVKQRTTVADRRRVFQSRMGPTGDALHTCCKCGATELSDAEVAFRISGGEEYCVPCLEKKKAAESGA